MIYESRSGSLALRLVHLTLVRGSQSSACMTHSCTQQAVANLAQLVKHLNVIRGSRGSKSFSRHRQLAEIVQKKVEVSCHLPRSGWGS